MLPTFISLTFGQNVTVSTLVGVFSLIINLAIFNGTQPLNTTFYKDGSVIMSSSSNSLIISNPTDDNFGTYTVIVSSESCGAAYAISRIFQGGEDIGYTLMNVIKCVYYYSFTHDLKHLFELVINPLTIKFSSE